MTTNSGVSISGGTVIGAVAGGRGAQATYAAGASQATSLEDLRRLLDDLRAQVVAEPAAIDDPDQAVMVTELAARELAKPVPDKGRLLGFLDVLTAVAAPVASISGSVAALTTAVSQVL